MKPDKKRLDAKHKFQKAVRTLLFALPVICAILSVLAARAYPAAVSVVPEPSNVRLEGNAKIFGLERAFSDDVYVEISVNGYSPASGSLILEGLITKMASHIKFIAKDGPVRMRFPAALINELPGGVHDIMVSSWNFQGRSEVVIEPVSVGKLFIKTAVPDVRVDYLSEKLVNLRYVYGFPYFRSNTRRPAVYSFKIGNESTTGVPDNDRAFPIPEEWMTGESISIVHLNENEELNSEPQIIRIPARAGAPWVFAIGEMFPGASDGRIFGVTMSMEYSADGGISWRDCPMWKIDNLLPGKDYRVRYKAIDGESFASRQTKLSIEPAPHFSPDVAETSQ